MPTSAAHGRAATGSDVASRLAFFKGLQSITTRIHAAQDIDEIIFELSADLCALFDAQRLSIYTVDETGELLVSRVKTGLHGIQAIRLPITEGDSIAGYVAQTRQSLNLRDVYDAVGYDLMLDYSRPPETPLDADTALWARVWLAAKL